MCGPPQGMPERRPPLGDSRRTGRPCFVYFPAVGIPRRDVRSRGARARVLDAAPIALALLLARVLASVAARAQGLEPVPVPSENPITEPKRLLGKILFWDEQVSSNDPIACGRGPQGDDAG